MTCSKYNPKEWECEQCNKKGLVYNWSGYNLCDKYDGDEKSFDTDRQRLNFIRDILLNNRTLDSENIQTIYDVCTKIK